MLNVQRGNIMFLGTVPITGSMCGRFQIRACIHEQRWKNRYSSTLSKEELYKLVETINQKKQWSTLSSNTDVRAFVLGNFSKSSDESVRALLQFKRKMVRCFKQRYSIALKYICEGLPTESDRLKFSSEFLLYVGPKKYEYFIRALSCITNDERMSRDEKLQEIYKYIEIHGKLNPEVTKSSGILLTADIHEWFYRNIPKQQWIQHYIFLVENNVKISGHFAEMMHRKLLQGSQTEFYVATFQHFLKKPGNEEIFVNKLCMVHSFKSMKKIVDLLIQKKEFTHIKFHLCGLTQKLEEFHAQRLKKSEGSSSTYIIEFLQTLQSFARASGNIDMFMEIMKSVTEFISTNTPAWIIRKSFSEILTFFQQSGNIEAAFKIMSLLDSYPITKTNTIFTNELIGRILFSLRQYNDPKLSASYLLRTYDLTKTRLLMNNFGLWCLIFEGKFGHLQDNIIINENFNEKAISINVPKDLHMSGVPDWVVLNELYLVTFNHYRAKLTKEEYRELLVNCYQAYIDTLKKSLPAKLRKSIDTSILKAFIHTIKYDLRDDRLAYDFLIHFFSIRVEPRLTRENSPFGLVLYQNRSLTQQEFSNVLQLMHRFNEPMDHKIMITLIQRFLQSGNYESAHQWYQKFLDSGYTLKHYSLIQAAIRNSWDVPEYALKYLQENDVDRDVDEEIMEEEYLQESTDSIHDDNLLEVVHVLGHKMYSKEV